MGRAPFTILYRIPHIGMFHVKHYRLLAAVKPVYMA